MIAAPTAEAVLKEMAGAVVDMELRTTIELGSRIDRWVAENQTDANLVALANEFDGGTMRGVETILAGWSLRSDVAQLLDAERHCARSETFEELVASDGKAAAEDLYRRMNLPVPARREV